MSDTEKVRKGLVALCGEANVRTTGWGTIADIPPGIGSTSEVLKAIAALTGHRLSENHTGHGDIVLMNGAVRGEAAEKFESLTREAVTAQVQRSKPIPLVVVEDDMELQIRATIGQDGKRSVYDARSHVLEQATGVKWEAGERSEKSLLGARPGPTYYITEQPMADPNAAKAALKTAFGADNCVVAKGRVCIAADKVPETLPPGVSVDKGAFQAKPPSTVREPE